MARVYLLTCFFGRKVQSTSTIPSDDNPEEEGELKTPLAMITMQETDYIIDSHPVGKDRS